jgi:hypothetical protein
VRLAADKAGAVVRRMKRIHPAAHLGADHEICAIDTPDRRSATMLGEATPIERRAVDAEREGALDR